MKEMLKGDGLTRSAQRGKIGTKRLDIETFWAVSVAKGKIACSGM